uniref:Uncharacterized protein n=1 Tax=Anguilla anguilla TaxID=7936 RepID=A0A0E9S3N6_ANGAN
MITVLLIFAFRYCPPCSALHTRGRGSSHSTSRLYVTLTFKRKNMKTKV